MKLVKDKTFISHWRESVVMKLFLCKICAMYRFSYGGSRSNSESRGRHRSSHSRSVSPRSISRSVSPANGRTESSSTKSKTTSAIYARTSRENGREPMTSSRYGYNNGQILSEASEATKRRYEGAAIAETGKRLARDNDGGRSSSRSRSRSSSQHD